MHGLYARDRCATLGPWQLRDQQKGALGDLPPYFNPATPVWSVFYDVVYLEKGPLAEADFATHVNI